MDNAWQMGTLLFTIYIGERVKSSMNEWQKKNVCIEGIWMIS